MFIKFRNNVFHYGTILLYIKVISCTGVHKISECFTLPVAVSGIQHTFPPRPTYNYRLADIPARVQVNLTCPEKNDNIHIQYAKYLFPAFSRDYCIDKNKECSESKPCPCCTKPARRICSQQVERYQEFCTGYNGTCPVDVPQVTFTNHAGCIPYECVDDTGKNWCVSRWIDVHYTCTSEEGTINNNRNSLLMVAIHQQQPTGSNTNMKELPTYSEILTYRLPRLATGTYLTYGLIIISVLSAVILRYFTVIFIKSHCRKTNVVSTGSIYAIYGDKLMPSNHQNSDVKGQEQQPLLQTVRTSDYLKPSTILTWAASNLDVIQYVQQPDCHLYESTTEESHVGYSKTESDKEYQKLTN